MRTRPERAPVLVGIVSAAATVAFLLPGAGRGLDFDSGIEVGLFVATRSIGDAFTHAFLLTNQVFFSFLEHLVYSATGSQSGFVLRLLPIAFAAAAVGLVATLLAQRFGMLAGLAGAAVMATNPLFAVEGSQVRGYSLVVLCTVVTTALLLRGVSSPPMSNAARTVYAVAGAVGVATHLYMLVVLAIHVVMSLRSRRLFTSLVVPWLGALIGLAAYVKIIRPMRLATQITGRTFQPTFPRDLGVELLGGGVVVTIIMLAFVATAGWRSRRDRTLQLALVGVVVAVAAVWVVAPTFLYPRFFLWLVPVPAIALAAVVARRPTLVVIVIAVVALQVHTAWPRLTTSAYPNVRAGHIVNEVTKQHGLPCVFAAYTALRILGYATSFAIVSTFERCTVVLSIGPPARSVRRTLDRRFAYRETLHAQTDGFLWSVVPTGCWTSRARALDCRLPRR